MKNLSKKSFITGTIVGIVVTIIFSSFNIVNFNKKDSKSKEIDEIIKQHFLYNKDVDQDTSYKRQLSALGDEYSEYYDKKEFKAFLESTKGEFVGVGILFSQDPSTKTSTAVEVYENSPAEEAGIKAGDILKEVNGEDVQKKDLSLTVKQIRGQENTKVTVTVLRNGQTITKQLTRRKIEVQTIKSKIVHNNIGYIAITQFTEDTHTQFQKALNDLESKNIKALIIDLRDNPGGLVSTTSSILDTLLPAGNTVIIRDSKGKENALKSDDKKVYTKPIAILVNENSASAAELFTGAMQDYGKATVIGTTTYGKGVVQQIFPLKDGSGIKLTVSEYFTPKKRPVHKKGITPDINVVDKNEQLNTAIYILKSKI
ncbi:MAG: S41 family peptidase [Eubacteriales bacterium]|nr:S41 family peptidase [Eubacteriales bacterium]MDY3332326.1 S41 family peptidase [Gallibacter sp.]